MARMKPESRKQELLEIAFKQFLHHGYDKTSIRSIVSEAGGEIGMFYHHFNSKEEIFNEALKQFNTEFIRKTTELAITLDDVPFSEIPGIILHHVGLALNEYSHMTEGNVDRKMMIILHHETLTHLKPIFCGILTNYIDKGVLSPPNIEISLLSDFLLSGVSAIIHNRQIASAEEKAEAIKILFDRLLDK